MDKTIIYCDSGHFKHYFVEYIMSLRINYKLYNEKNDDFTEIPELIDKNYVIIFIRKIPIKVQQLSIDKKKLYFINTEQLSRSNFENNLSDIINHGINIIDYSLINIKFLNKNNKNIINKPIYYIPYQFNRLEYDILNSELKQKKIYDISICSNNSTRRNYIFTELQKKGLVCVDVKDWGYQRDNIIAQSKVLINIHKEDDFKIYESMRCDRWIFAKMLVITENSYNEESNDLKDLLIIEKYDHLVDKIVDVINNYNFYYGNFIKQYNNTIIKIIRTRENNFNNLNFNINLNLNLNLNLKYKI